MSASIAMRAEKRARAITRRSGPDFAIRQDVGPRPLEMRERRPRLRRRILVNRNDRRAQPAIKLRVQAGFERRAPRSRRFLALRCSRSTATPSRRSYHALPKTIRWSDGKGAGAILRFARKAGTIDLVIQAVGSSSIGINAMEVGEAFSGIAGPLGQPSKLHRYDGDQTVVFCAGGLGLPPVYPIMRAHLKLGNQ